MPSTKYSFGMRASSLEILAQRGGIVRHRQVERGGVVRVVPGHGAQQERASARTSSRADLVERRGVGRQPVSRNAAVGRFQSHAAQKEAGWRMDPPVSVPRAAMASSAPPAADPPLDPPGTQSAFQGLRVVLKRSSPCSTHGELVHVRPARKTRPARAARDRVLVTGPVTARILDPQVQGWPSTFSTSSRPAARPGARPPCRRLAPGPPPSPGQERCRRRRQVRLQLRVGRLDRPKHVAHEVLGAAFLARQPLHRLVCRQCVEPGTCYSMIFGR